MTDLLRQAKQTAADSRADARASGARDELEAAQLAVAKAARDEMLEKDSILKD